MGMEPPCLGLGVPESRATGLIRLPAELDFPGDPPAGGGRKALSGIRALRGLPPMLGGEGLGCSAWATGATRALTHCSTVSAGSQAPLVAAVQSRLGATVLRPRPSQRHSQEEGVVRARDPSWK